jgi:uncharacterized protein YcfL
MKAKQPTLKNFLVFSHLNLFSSNVLISKSGIIHANRKICPDCGAECNYNGRSNKGKHIFSKSNNSLFLKGQQYCPVCNKTIQVKNKWLEEIIESLNHFIVAQVLSLSDNLSENEIADHLINTMSIKISKSTIHNIIDKSNEEFKKIDFDYEIKDHFYGYDEQYLKINGKRAYRLVFMDYKENKVIYEKIHYKFSKNILKEVLKDVFKNIIPKGFVVDMKIEYPKAFKEVFGRKIKVQYCVFHLNKLILKEYCDSLKVGKSIKWKLMHYYNMYTLFNIFYNRTFELKLIKKLLKHFENFKSNLTFNKIKFYVKKYSIKIKTPELQKEKVIQIIERKLMKNFRKILHEKKNYRKNQRKTLKVRNTESAIKVFEKIYTEINIFPKKIRDRIEKINKNFNYLIASEGEVLTNNKLEGFFGATLKKFRKKGRKSLISFASFLKRKRAKQTGITYFRKFSIFDLAKIFTVLTLFS